MTEIISLFIDDEMKVEDKIDFVERVRDQAGFAQETLDLLRLERMVRARDGAAIPQILPARPGIVLRAARVFLQPMGWVSTALAAALIALVMTAVAPSAPALVPSRFVIYLPQVHQVEIAGSFTNWRPIPLQRAGDSGYWEIQLALSKGEYQFTYIVDGGRRLTDPTIRPRERDDFGGYNSILKVNGSV